MSDPVFPRDVLGDPEIAVPLPLSPQNSDILPALRPPPDQRPDRGVHTDGKFLRVNGERFWVKGVTYGTFAPNDEGEPYPPIAQVREDFSQMAAAGINTVRLYTPPSDRMADAAADAGLYLIPDICWGPRYCELHRTEDLNAIRSWAESHARRLAQHPAMLMFCIGNEIPPLLVRWYGRTRIEAFLRELYDIVKTHAPEGLVTYACHPPTEHLHLPFLDVVSFNIYLEREHDFRRYLARLQSLAGERPLLLTEIGLDSSAQGPEAQAHILDWQLRATFEKGLCGATIYSWTDEWAIFKERVAGWSFGLLDADRKPKPAMRAVTGIFQSSLYGLRRKPWPRVSVVVCSYNSGSTLEQCLRSLANLNYPDYEIIVIDDGSADNTSSIARRFPTRCIRTENGGLSRARNMGIAESSGEIVAFLDADAYADPDWLFHMVSAMEERDAAAVGGPNLSPPQDPFISQCVDHAPGNPTHVLIDDELAEHVPGCNMAFRKSAFQEIGRFDVVHRAAGDDVDVCWKLIARGQRIAFAAGAVVWHHRRPTVRKFFRQQMGYGFAEAHLRKRYPSRFNVFGYAVWSGSIYDGPHHAIRRDGIPRLLRPRIYQGRFCSAPFQSLYQPFSTWWFQIFTTVEWQSLFLSVLATGLLALKQSGLVSAWMLAIALAMLLTIVGAAATAGRHAVRNRRWRGTEALYGGAVVALLHILQPWARAVGRIKGCWSVRHETWDWPVEQKLWGNISQREIWLERLMTHVRRCGWRCAPAGDWDDADLVVSGPGPYRLTLTSVAEERLEKQWYFVRYRISAKPKLSGRLITLAILAALFTVGTFSLLLPLSIPLLIALHVMLTSRRSMMAAFSQMATEMAEVCNMPRVEGGY